MKFFLFPLLFLFILEASGQSAEQPSLFDLLQAELVTEIYLETDWDSLDINRNAKSDFKGKFMWASEQGATYLMEVKLSARGRFRRRYCDTPPITLNFPKKALDARGLARFDDMKLVTPCKDADWGEDRVIREYTAYKLYQILSPYSYRVQLVRVHFLNKDPGQPRTSCLGYLIEDGAQLEHRLQGVLIDTFNLPETAFHPANVRMQALFQYLIGNADWNMPVQRNVKFLKLHRDSSLVMIPFDFDFSGLVNAPYAIPNPDYQLSHVRDRIYLGAPRPAQDLKPQADEILMQRKAMLALIRNTKLLSEESRSEMILYLSEGFRELKLLELRFPENPASR